MLPSGYRVDWFSGTGPGGQHRNKSQNCARVTHTETGITAVGTAHRSRQSNLRDAFNVCRARVQMATENQTERFRASQERVRTYHEPRGEVIDHASGKKFSYQDIMDNPENAINARRIAIGENHD